MYSGEYDACDVTLSVYPHRASLKNMPDHGGNRTYDLWNTTRLKTHRLLQVDIDRREQCCAANYEQVVNHVVPSCYS